LKNAILGWQTQEAKRFPDVFLPDRNFR